MGVLLKDEQLIDDALNQYYWHIKYLQDPESGLYYHGYNNITGDHMSGIKWGRANALAAYTMSQVGIRLPQCYLYPKFLDVVGSLNDQLAALKLYQTENGLWRTIVDDETSYEEVSASAGIAAAMIAKSNPLHIKPGWPRAECFRRHRGYERCRRLPQHQPRLDSGLGPGIGACVLRGCAEL